MRIVVGLLMAWLMAVPLSWASEYTQEGKVVMTGYTGPGFGAKDAAYLGTLALISSSMAIADLNPMASLGTLAAGTILYGAVRTNYYRPLVVKQAMKQRMLVKQRQPKPGTIQELLGWGNE
jgi:hypothetical protein